MAAARGTKTVLGHSTVLIVAFPNDAAVDATSETDVAQNKRGRPAFSTHVAGAARVPCFLQFTSFTSADFTLMLQSPRCERRKAGCVRFETAGGKS